MRHWLLLNGARVLWWLLVTVLHGSKTLEKGGSVEEASGHLE